MCKPALIFLITILFLQPVFARHIKGGWIQYEYAGPSSSVPGSSVYKITVYVFKDCVQNGPMPGALTIYDVATNAKIQSLTPTYSLVSTPVKKSFDPCLSNPPTICYQIYTATATVTLADNPNGYSIVASDANRITGIVNITNSVSTGISFVAQIPGTINSVDYHANSSPYFNFTDTAIICYNAKFSYQYIATDADGDSLTYSFGDGINGTAAATPPPYSPLSYSAGFSGKTPLGTSVKIDSLTGLISGTAPATTGEYVIAVYVHEWRKGVLINSTRKELQITVGDCSLSAASLKPVYLNCDNFLFNFQNETAASNINSYLWDFGVKTSANDTSTKATPAYTYADTGTYTIKLVLSNTGGCIDSANALVKVYPGFTPAFSFVGRCFQTPFQFSDISLVKYGNINNRLWDFGDLSSVTDTSSAKNAVYQYPSSGNFTATLSISSSVGCTGTASQTFTANDKPYIFLPFTDTLICSIDSLPLKAQINSGKYAWTPNYRISDSSKLNPIVYPKDTTTYTITVTDQGCIDSAKIRVNVLKFITVKLGLDTGICKTDSFMLRPLSDALSYHWRESTNAGSLSDYNIRNPIASPLKTTTYFVTANLGYCQDSAKFTVNVSPYPIAQLGNDTAICFGSRIFLPANITGAYFKWSPATSLFNTSSITPIAGPSKTTSYVLTVGDTVYCKKLVSDTITVKVVQPFNVWAGKDTTVTIDQPLQLMAQGADTSYLFQWTPDNFLDNAAIFNPVATINSNSIDSIRYQVKVISPEGCNSMDDLIVRIYKGGSDILVPNAFTPNADGKNDVLKPLLFGITKFDYFNIYNRWGQLVYSTTQRDAGWDGELMSVKQGSGTYVYTAQGADFSGKIIYRKGTVVLIR